jgi:serine/threonine protein kinase
LNAHRAALLHADYAVALIELLEAIRLDGRRVATFPVGKYIPSRILDSDGFGATYLCKHKHSNSRVVVKTFSSQKLEYDVDDIFRELKALDALNHPAIVRVLECGYVDAPKRQRPFIVTDCFDGLTLDQYVAKNGPLSANDLTVIAELVAAALESAHAKNILHRNIRPSNLLVKCIAEVGASSRWKVKLIDFGLAVKQREYRASRNPKRPGANAAEYASPEQLGRLPGVEVGPRSDIYSFAMTCCYALFRTTSASTGQFHGVPQSLAELLVQSLNENPADRPASFGEIRQYLARLVQKAAPTPPISSAFEIVD